MIKRNRYLFLIMISFAFAFAFGFMPQTTYASTLDTPSLKISPNLEDVENSSLGYYNFKLQKDKTYSIEVDITNHTDKKRFFSASLLDATTDQNGHIVYQNKEQTYGIRQFNKDRGVKESIRPNETKKIKFKLKVPAKIKSATYLGGIQVTELATQDSSVNIKNDIQVINSIILFDDQPETENINRIQVNRIKPINTATKKGYLVSVTNNTSRIIRDMSISLKVKKGSNGSNLSNVTLGAYETTQLFFSDDSVVDNHKKIDVTLKKNKSTRRIEKQIDATTDANKKSNRMNHTNELITIGIASLLFILLLLSKIRRGGKNESNK